MQKMKQDLQRICLAAAFPCFLMFVLYLLKFLETGMDWDFCRLGIYPREQRGVFGIFAHPLIHSSYRHLMANTLPLFFLSWCLFYFYRGIASYIFFTLWIGCGLLTFVIGQPGWHVGASGLIYGLAFFLFFSGLLRRHVPLTAISLLVTFLYGGLVWNMFPTFAKATTSWEGHLSGAVAGVVCAVAFMKQGPQRPDPFEEEDEEEETEQASDTESALLQRLKQLGDVGGEETDRNGQQDDAEELTDDIDASLTQEAFDPPRKPHYDIDPNHIEHQRNDDVDAGILGTQGEQCGEGSGTGQ